MKERFLVGLTVGFSVLTGVAYAASNPAARSAGIGLVCTILLKAHHLAHHIYRVVLGH